MPNLTTNYQLEKPLGTENYDINVHNRNMDKLDVKVKEVDAKVDNVKNEVSSMEFVSTKVIRPNKQTVEQSLVASENSIGNHSGRISANETSILNLEKKTDSIDVKVETKNKEVNDRTRVIYSSEKWTFQIPSGSSTFRVNSEHIHTGIYAIHTGAQSVIIFSVARPTQNAGTIVNVLSYGRYTNNDESVGIEVTGTGTNYNTNMDTNGIIIKTTSPYSSRTMTMVSLSIISKWGI